MNYYATWRSNHVWVKDVEKFREIAERAGGSVPNPKITGRFRIVAVDSEVTRGPTRGQVYILGSEQDGGFSETFDDHNDGPQMDTMTELSKTLEKGQVLVIQEAGAEGIRYVNGWSSAIDWRGKRVDVHIDDIYAKAAKAFRIRRARINVCSY